MQNSGFSEQQKNGGSGKDTISLQSYEIFVFQINALKGPAHKIRGNN